MNVRKVKVIQHIACETLGIIAPVLEKAGIAYQYIQPFAGGSVPKSLFEDDGLIIMGGPMGVGEEKQFPYLLDEMLLIENTVSKGKPVLGICLGSQLIATVLGVKVSKGHQKEIGWHKVRLTDFASTDMLLSNISCKFQALHWHGDVFDLPREATPLAFSERTANQAFRYGQNIYGILFHMEVTRQQIAKMVTTFKDELCEAGIDGETILEETSNYIAKLHEIGDCVFQRWTSLITKS